MPEIPIVNQPDAHGPPPPAVTISVLPHAQGQHGVVVVNHRVAGGWKAVQQFLLAALHIAVAQELQESSTKPPPPSPLVTPATMDPRPDPRVRPERG